MSSQWRYIAQRLNGDGTGTFLDFDLPLADVEIEDVLSGTSGLNARISPEIARLVGPDGLPIFAEWSTAIYAERDGEIHGGGILTHSTFDAGTWALECSGFTGYAKGMPYTGGGAAFVKTDVLDIVRYIWAHIQSQDGGDIGLTFDQRKSGVMVGTELASEDYDPEGGPGGLTLQTQAYKLAWYQDHDLSENIDNLAQDAPFDYHERHYWENDEIIHRVDFGVDPAVGRDLITEPLGPQDDPLVGIGRRRKDLRFAIGENIFIRPSIERDGEQYADEVIALGAGEGARMIRGYASAPRTRLRRVAVITDSSMRRVARANSAAAAELQWRRVLDDFTTVTVRDHPAAPIGAVNVGDEIRIQGKVGWIEVDAWFRVLSRTIRPDSSGTMELNLRRSDKLTA